jgi:hypothetical protein
LQDIISLEREYADDFKYFSSKGLFISWLANQSDFALSGAHLPEGMRGNQRLTIARLKLFALG